MRRAATPIARTFFPFAFGLAVGCAVCYVLVMPHVTRFTGLAVVISRLSSRICSYTIDPHRPSAKRRGSGCYAMLMDVSNEQSSDVLVQTLPWS